MKNDTVKDRLTSHLARISALRYGTIRDVISRCAQKLTQVSLIYRTERKTKKWGERRTKK